MFEGDLTTLTTADLLESTAEYGAVANRAETRRLEAALVYADRYHPSVCLTRPGRRACDGRERAVVLGGDGCPEIAEFAIAEFAVMIGVSPRVAADYLGQALALRHRFPFTWARVLAGDATPWKARRLTTDCLKLSQEAAAYVDQRVAHLIDSITPYRLEKIVRAAKNHADPDLARAEADEKARERGVFVSHSDQHGTKTMCIKAPSGAVTRNKATLNAIADALHTFGDTRPVQHRRADAVGIIADPRFTEELLAQARLHRLNNPTTSGANDTPQTTDTADSTATDTPDTAAAPQTPGAAAPAGAGDTTGAADATVAGAIAPDGEQSNATDDASAASAARNHSTTPAPAPGNGPVDRTSSPASEPGSWWADQDPLDDETAHWACDWDEPDPDDEADRDAPHPSTSNLPDPLDTPRPTPVEPFDPGDPSLHLDPDDREPLDAAARRALHARLAQIKHDAYTKPTTRGGRVRPGQTEIYVHLTDHTLTNGTGVLRAETIGPLIADQLTELIGYGPYTVKPVIDLNGAISVDAYEIPDRIRERIKLTHPVELFPYGTQETRPTMDLDHIRPYDPLGPPGQTSTHNLAPLGRFGHRVKTHAHGWNVRRVDDKTLEWTTPHGFRFHVGPTGITRVDRPQPECPT